MTQENQQRNMEASGRLQDDNKLGSVCAHTLIPTAFLWNYINGTELFSWPEDAN